MTSACANGRSGSIVCGFAVMTSRDPRGLGTASFGDDAEQRIALGEDAREPVFTVDHQDCADVVILHQAGGLGHRGRERCGQQFLPCDDAAYRSLRHESLLVLGSAATGSCRAGNAASKSNAGGSRRRPPLARQPDGARRPSGSGRVKAKVEPVPDRALDPDLPAVKLDELPRDGEAESGAFHFPGCRADLPELLEHRRLVLGRDAHPGVGHRDLDRTVVRLRPQRQSSHPPA